MAKLCLQTTHLDEEIRVFQNEHGYFFCAIGLDFEWSSFFNFRSLQEALNSCFVHQACDQVDRLPHPAGIFSIETGAILHTNTSHQKWLGHSALRMHRDEVLNRVANSERTISRIFPTGTLTVGVYEIWNAETPFDFDISNQRIWESLTAFYGFLTYHQKSREILERWVSLGDTPEFQKRLWKDLETLDGLKGIK